MLRSYEGSEKSVTYLYREFPVPGIFHFFGGIGTGIGTDFRRQNLGILKVYNGYQNQEFFLFLVVSEKFGSGKKSRNRYR